MNDPSAPTSPPPTPDAPPPAVKPRRGRGCLTWVGGIVLLFALAGVAIRLAMPSTILWYVNRTLQQNPLFRGKIDEVRVHLWRGAYSIEGMRFIKTTGDVPVPLFSAERLDLSIEWSGLLHGRVIGKVRMDKPELNFVDAPPEKGQKSGDNPGSQTGGGGPWLAMLSDLFPFQINRVDLADGSVHFRTYQDKTPVDVYLSDLNASVDDLTNVKRSSTSLVTTVHATALAMDQAKFECNMKLDPFSYRPTFHLTSRLLNLDVTKINALTRTYGAFDFEGGWFDLVIDLDAKEGLLYGYVKPLFRNLKIFTTLDLKDNNPLNAFWQALVGGAELVLKNQGRDQFGTIVPFKGDVTDPKIGILDAVGNVLRNAFIRAYLPRLQNQGKISDADAMLLFETPTDDEAVLGTDDKAQ